MARLRGYAGIAVAGIVLAACSSQREPAQKLISGIETVVTAASPDAAKYVPDRLTDVQNTLGGLKTSFDTQDYAAVLGGAPAVMSAAQGLSGAAAAKKGELQELDDQWTGLAAAVPDSMTILENRSGRLSKKSTTKRAAGIDLDAARGSLSDASLLWSKAQAGFAAGNMAEAVTTAKRVGTKLDRLATSLKVDLPAPAVAPASMPELPIKPEFPR